MEYFKLNVKIFQIECENEPQRQATILALKAPTIKDSARAATGHARMVMGLEI